MENEQRIATDFSSAKLARKRYHYFMTTGTRKRVTFWLLLLTLACCLLAFIRLRHPPHQTPQTWQPQASTFGDRHYYAGMPQPDPAFPFQISVLTNAGFVVGFCEARKEPVWACYRLFRLDNLYAPTSPYVYRTDSRTQARIAHHDYLGSDYNPGHLAPNYAIAGCYGTTAQRETFLLSNIMPQAPKMKYMVWEQLEQLERKTYAQRFQQIWVVAGPVFDQDAPRLKCGVAVPSACFKILVKEANGEPGIICLLIPQTAQQAEPLENFLTSVEEVEKRTGLTFFPALPRELQDRVKTGRSKRMW